MELTVGRSHCGALELRLGMKRGLYFPLIVEKSSHWHTSYSALSCFYNFQGAWPLHVQA